jgi:hypothetical protein
MLFYTTLTVPTTHVTIAIAIAIAIAAAITTATTAFFMTSATTTTTATAITTISTTTAYCYSRHQEVGSKHNEDITPPNLHHLPRSGQARPQFGQPTHGTTQRRATASL